MTNPAPAPAAPPAGSTEPAPAGSTDNTIGISEPRARDAAADIANLAVSVRALATETSSAATDASAATVAGPDDTAGAQALLGEITGEIAAFVSSAAADAGAAAESAAETATAATEWIDRELGTATDGAAAIGAIGGPA